MKTRLFILLLIATSGSRLLAQEFKGFVLFRDSLSSPVYQAKVTVVHGGERDVLKTYFNGSFSFPVSKNQTYSLFVSYPGYVDTLFTITTDKYNHPNPPEIKVRLKRDGMRLLGIIRGMDDNFPVDSATVLMKNILTRKETKQTTEIDGAYNLKLEYETNYSISITWRWPGAPDRYRDTMIFISTIGFNQPLDYKLDIYLERLKPGELATGQRMNYDNQQSTDIGAIKPGGKSSALEPPDVLANDFGLMARKLQFESHVRDSTARATALKDSVLEANLMARQKRLVDSLAIANAEREKMRNEIKERKVFGDSVSAALVAARQRVKQDSITLGKLEKGKKVKPSNEQAANDDKTAAKKRAKEDAAKKLTEDSAANASAAAQRQMVQDSLERVKSEKKEKAREQAAHKAFEDSLAKTRVVEQKKHKEDSLLQVKNEKAERSKESAAQKASRDSMQRALSDAQKKRTEDSLQQVKIETEKRAKEQAAKKAAEDSLARASAAAREKSLVDSIQRAYKEKVKSEKGQAAQKKHAEDSIARALTAARQKSTTDSIVQVKKEREQAARKDSIARALLATQKKHPEDSLTAVKTEAEKKAREQAAKKATQDSIARAVVAARQKNTADSIERVKKEKEQAARKDSIARVLLAVQKKHSEDSLIQVRKEAAKKAKEQAAKKAVADSLARAQAVARQKSMTDSLERVKKEKGQAARKDSIARVLLAAQKKHAEDSLIQVRKEAEKKAKEQAEKKAGGDSMARAQAVARQKSMTDSLERVKKEKEQAARKAIKDSIERAALIAQKKHVEDSVQRVKAEAEKKVKEQALKKAAEDSLAKVREVKMIQQELAAQRKFEDSVSRVKTRQEASMAAKTNTSAKTGGDSTSRVIASLLKRAREDSLKVGMEATRRKKLSDSLRIIKSAEQKMQVQISSKKVLLDSIHNAMTAEQGFIKNLEAPVPAGDSKSDPPATGDELSKHKAVESSLLKMWNEKHKEIAGDSLALKKLDREKAANEEAAKRAYVDSIVGGLDELRLKREMDSIKEMRAFLAQVALDKALSQKQDPGAKTASPVGNTPGHLPTTAIPHEIDWPGLFSAKISQTPATNMPAVAFGKNSSAINPNELDRLKSLGNLLAVNPQWRVCIYALSSADENSPKFLSLKRMDSVIRLLLQEGIPVQRISSFYFGSDVNLTGCAGAPCSEEALQKNRRLAFQIVKP